jgi:hypothetical protein
LMDRQKGKTAWLISKEAAFAWKLRLFPIRRTSHNSRL